MKNEIYNNYHIDRIYKLVYELNKEIIKKEARDYYQQNKKIILEQRHKNKLIRREKRPYNKKEMLNVITTREYKTEPTFIIEKKDVILNFD